MLQRPSSHPRASTPHASCRLQQSTQRGQRLPALLCLLWCPQRRAPAPNRTGTFVSCLHASTSVLLAYSCNFFKTVKYIQHYGAGCDAHKGRLLQQEAKRWRSITCCHTPHFLQMGSTPLEKQFLQKGQRLSVPWCSNHAQLDDLIKDVMRR